MLFQMSLFIIVGLGVYFGAHYFLYFSIVRFFSIASHSTRAVAFLVLLFLSLNFIAASLLAHFKENLFTKIFYISSGFWLGLLTNLVLAAAAVWLVILLSKTFNLNSSSYFIGGLVFLAAIVYSIYGTWNAFNPKIKNIAVEIKNLPPAWREKTVIQLSDVHLGHVYQADFMEKIVQQINALNPEAVFITGDLFDGMDGDLDSFAKPLNDIRAGKGIYFVTGNHETYLGVSRVFNALAQTKVKVLNNEVVDIDGLKIIGLNYPERGAANKEFDILQSLKNEFFGQPNILLFHSPVNIDQVAQSGVNLQLAGHTHKGQIFPFGFITSLVYKGYDYGLHEMGNYSIYTSSGVGTWGPPMRTGNTPEIVKITLK